MAIDDNIFNCVEANSNRIECALLVDDLIRRKSRHQGTMTDGFSDVLLFKGWNLSGGLVMRLVKLLQNEYMMRTR